MADPTTIAVIAKAAATALSDERTRKGIGWIIAAVLSPLILIIVLICSLLSGTADHNSTAVDLCFQGGVISGNVPESYRGYIEDMRGSFALIDGALADRNAEMEDGGSLDSVRVKAVFYSLFFGAESPSRLEHRRYVDCFVTYEERTRTVENDDGTTSEETYTVAVPISSLPAIYNNIRSLFGRAITYDDQANANEIYYRALYGIGAPADHQTRPLIFGLRANQHAECGLDFVLHGAQPGLRRPAVKIGAVVANVEAQSHGLKYTGCAHAPASSAGTPPAPAHSSTNPHPVRHLFTYDLSYTLIDLDRACRHRALTLRRARRSSRNRGWHGRRLSPVSGDAAGRLSRRRRVLRHQRVPDYLSAARRAPAHGQNRTR